MHVNIYFRLVIAYEMQGSVSFSTLAFIEMTIRVRTLITSTPFMTYNARKTNLMGFVPFTLMNNLG